MPLIPSWSSKLVAADAGGLGLCAPLPPPDVEARALLKLARHNGDGLDEIRELIAVPANVQAALRAYAEAYRKEREGIETILRFRERVAEEFEKLVAGNDAATDGKIEKSSQEAR